VILTKLRLVIRAQLAKDQFVSGILPFVTLAILFVTKLLKIVTLQILQWNVKCQIGECGRSALRLAVQVRRQGSAPLQHPTKMAAILAPAKQ
jgi:hypothetical protein